VNAARRVGHLHTSRRRRPALVIPLLLAALSVLPSGCGSPQSKGPTNDAGPTQDAGPTVVPPPSNLSYPTPNVFTAGTAIDALEPTVTGVVDAFSVAPALPQGLVLQTRTGVISGIPSMGSVAQDYVVSAENDGGATTAPISIAVTGFATIDGGIGGLIAAGTSVAITTAITPVGFTVSGNLFASVNDTAGLFLPTVTVTSKVDGYILGMATSQNAPASHYSGLLTVELCGDSGCSTHPDVPFALIPYDVWVLSATSAWPGDNLTALEAWPGVPDWEMFQGNAAHTGFVPVGLDPNRFTTRWHRLAGQSSSNEYVALNSVTTSGGLVFSGEANRLVVRSESDGGTVWQHDFSTLAWPSVNAPSVANGTVYVAAGQQTSTAMYGFQASDGGLVFNAGMASQFEHYLAPTIGPQGVYTNAGEYGGLYGFDAGGGALFFTPLAQTSTWTPAVDGTRLYAYTGGALQIIDPVSGIILGSIPDPTFSDFVHEIDGSPVVGAINSVFAANYANAALNGCSSGNYLNEFNIDAGTIAWQVVGCFPTTPAYREGVIYIANDNPLRLEARAENDGGSLLWVWSPHQLGDERFAAEVLVTENMVFVSTDVATYGVDLVTQNLLFSVPISGRLALSSDGVLYIASSGLLTAINVK
jgi:outer membrane protein assembly factor BamB